MSHRRTVLATTAIFAALTSLFTYPLWLAPGSLLHDLGDSRLNAWILAWDAHALLTDPLQLFNANIFHPHARTLAFSENLLGTAVLVAPINWAGGPVLAYNVALLLSFVLTGVGTTLWVRHLSGSTGAGLVAGVIWTFGPAKLDQLAHLQMLTGQWVPFALWAMTLYLETGRRRHALLCAGLVGFQFLTSLQVGLLGAPFLVLYGVLLYVHLSRPAGVLPTRRLVKDLLLAGGFLAAVVVPVGIPYLQVSAAEGFRRDLPAQVSFSAQPGNFLAPAPTNRATHMVALRRHFRDSGGNVFPGAVPGALLLLALVRPLRRRRRFQAEGTGGPGRPFRAFLAVGLVAGALHGAGVLLAVWWWLVGTVPPADVPGAAAPGLAGWVLALNRRLHPTVWLAVASVLAAATWVPTRRGRSEGANRETIYVVVLGCLLTLGYLLALGPVVRAWNVELGHGPYRLLQLMLPYQGLRAPRRMGVLWFLFTAALAGTAVAALVRRLGPTHRPIRDRLAVGAGVRGRPDRRRRPGRSFLRWGAVALLIFVIVLEYRAWPLPFAPADPSRSAADRWLAEQPGKDPVLHLPIPPHRHAARETEHMLASTLHWRPLVNGYSGYFPTDYLRLAQIPPFTEEFYRVIREGFPVKYLVVHGDLFGGDFARALAPRLLEDRQNLEFVARRGPDLIFRHRRDWDRGSRIRRRYPADFLAGVRGIFLEARLTPGTPEGSYRLEGTWGGIARGPWSVGRQWRQLTIPAPERYRSHPNGTATVELRTTYRHQFDERARWLAARVVLDVQADGVGLILNGAVADDSPSPGYHVLRLGADGTFVEEWLGFEHTAAGARRLRQHLEGVPEGALVACAVHLREPGSLPAVAVAALRSLGSGVLPGTGPFRRLALIGVKGLAPGSALEAQDMDRATVAVGGPGRPPAIELRRIREVQE